MVFYVTFHFRAAPRAKRPDALCAICPTTFLAHGANIQLRWAPRFSQQRIKWGTHTHRPKSPFTESAILGEKPNGIHVDSLSLSLSLARARCPVTTRYIYVSVRRIAGTASQDDTHTHARARPTTYVLLLAMGVGYGWVVLVWYSRWSFCCCWSLPAPRYVVATATLCACVCVCWPCLQSGAEVCYMGRCGVCVCV